MFARRNLKMALAGLLCLLLGGTGLMLAWHQTSAAQNVLVTTRDISAGQVLAAGDVQVARLGLGAGVTAVGVDAMVAGQIALVDLPHGSVVAAGAVGQPTPPAQGLARLSVVVGVGLAPTTVLTVGALVGLCGPSGQIISATMASEPQLLPDAARYRFDVLVAVADAAPLAQWVANGSVVVSTS